MEKEHEPGTGHGAGLCRSPDGERELGGGLAKPSDSLRGETRTAPSPYAWPTAASSAPGMLVRDGGRG